MCICHHDRDSDICMIRARYFPLADTVSHNSADAFSFTNTTFANESSKLARELAVATSVLATGCLLLPVAALAQH